MSSVKKGDRKRSKSEFDNNYFAIHDDFIKLKENNLGVKGDLFEKYKTYIEKTENEILEIIFHIGTYIRIANSIYPMCQMELEERRLAQKKAIGLCYDLMTKYQIVMCALKVPDDKYTNEIKHIIHEINCLKSWRKSDASRFKDLG